MGVGRTVYKGEVETGVVAWFWTCTARLAIGRGWAAQPLWERACSRRGSVSKHWSRL